MNLVKLINVLVLYSSKDNGKPKVSYDNIVFPDEEIVRYACFVMHK